jgi:hypothetical protein
VRASRRVAGASQLREGTSAERGFIGDEPSFGDHRYQKAEASTKGANCQLNLRRVHFGTGCEKLRLKPYLRLGTLRSPPNICYCNLQYLQSGAVC